MIDDKLDPASLASVDFPSQYAVWKVADDHGWHNPPNDFPTDLLLLHSEVSEISEAYRKDDTEGIAEELADVILLTLHIAEKAKIDIAEAVWKKFYKNIQRPYRHGGKKF